MGVFKRYRDAQAAQKDAENAMPGAYQSNYTDRINETLDSELYRQYRAGAQANARAAAENAAAGAAALSGGYGSSYANSVAQQGYQQAMANVDDGLAGLRDKALTMYQLKQNGLSGLLSALQNQDSLEAAEHQGAVANAQDWRDYKKSRADQAAQEKSSFWSNLLDTVMNIGGALVNGYDAYKGFSRQKEQDKLSAIAQAAQYHRLSSSTVCFGCIFPDNISSIKLQKASENIANLRRTSTIKQIEQNSTKMPNNSTYQTAVISWVNAYKATETVAIAASRRTAKKIQALLTESFRTFISAPLRSTYSPYHIPF